MKVFFIKILQYQHKASLFLFKFFYFGHHHNGKHPQTDLATLLYRTKLKPKKKGGNLANVFLKKKKEFLLPKRINLTF